jgi:hypothetical protein
VVEKENGAEREEEEEEKSLSQRKAASFQRITTVKRFGTHFNKILSIFVEVSDL